MFPQSKLQLVPYVPDQPCDKDGEKCGAEAPVGDLIGRVEIGRLQIVAS